MADPDKGRDSSNPRAASLGEGTRQWRSQTRRPPVRNRPGGGDFPSRERRDIPRRRHPRRPLPRELRPQCGASDALEGATATPMSRPAGVAAAPARGACGFSGGREWWSPLASALTTASPGEPRTPTRAHVTPQREHDASRGHRGELLP